MIKIIVFNGGLGNQMFQYAFYLALKKKHPMNLFLFNIRGAINEHNGFELFDIFNINERNKVRLFNLLNHRFNFIFKKFFYVNPKVSLIYNSKYLQDNRPFSIYEGYWQTEKYFSNVAEDVIKSFRFKKQLLNNKTKELGSKLTSQCYCSIHVRRGDYLDPGNEGFGVQSLDYYCQAIEYIKKRNRGINFCIFSDSIDWCKEKLRIPDAVYVNWNKDRDSWQDMYLMSCCHHNIVANSSFSWWGAWLNPNLKKIVVAPKVWFFRFKEENLDVIPADWVRL